MTSAAHLQETWHRTLLDELCGFDRETATAGEHAAAGWLIARLTEEGVVDARIEEERSHQTFWWPIGLAAGTGVIAGAAGARAARRRARGAGEGWGRRLPAAALGAAGAWAAACELPPRRHRLRGLLPQSTATNVLATLGPADATRTVVLVAHHDAAHSGLFFSPAIPEGIARVAPWFFEVTNTSPPIMWPTVIGPALAALGAATGRRRVALGGALLSAAAVGVLANIGASAVVPGANDNGTGVVTLIALARALRAHPTQSVRVMLVSTSEEGLCEGMRAFADRHFPELPLADTFFLAIDTVGSERLLVLRGEGMLGIHDYPERAFGLVVEAASTLGIPLATELRLRNATDGVYPLAAGYECASLCSCTALKQPANYHWPTDVPENVDFGTLADAIRVTEALVRRLDERWLD